MIHPPHLTPYAIVAATTYGASLVFLVFVSLYSIARVLVDLMRWARERGEGRRDLRSEKAHRLAPSATSGSISGSTPPQTSRRSGGSGLSTPVANGFCDAAKGAPLAGIGREYASGPHGYSDYPTIRHARFTPR
jgi:hypothetical protein